MATRWTWQPGISLARGSTASESPSKNMPGLLVTPLSIERLETKRVDDVAHTEPCGPLTQRLPLRAYASRHATSPMSTLRRRHGCSLTKMCAREDPELALNSWPEIWRAVSSFRGVNWSLAEAEVSGTITRAACTSWVVVVSSRIALNVRSKDGTDGPRTFSEVIIAQVSIAVHVATCNLPLMQAFAPLSSYPSAHRGKHAEWLESIGAQSGPRAPSLGGIFRQALQQAGNVAPVAGSQHASESFPWASVQHSSQVLPLKHPGGPLGIAQAVVTCSHVAARRLLARQREAPDGRNPASHMGWHIWPLARTGPHVPVDPWRGALVISHAKPTHDAGISAPFKHEVIPESVYPSSQPYPQCCPCLRTAEQLPKSPNIGGRTSHGSMGRVGALEMTNSGCSKVGRSVGLWVGYKVGSADGESVGVDDGSNVGKAERVSCSEATTADCAGASADG
jgi:hypothetical protein